MVVFGERPYAEFQGDLKSLQLTPDLTAPWETMRRLRAQHIPVVAVMLTGRPLFVNPALNAANAFVVTWLPGSEGEGLADVLVGDAGGHPRFAMTGRLPTAWPRTARAADGVLFPFGYGLTWHDRTRDWTPLSEDPGVAPTGDARRWFANGQPASGWSLRVEAADGSGSTRVTTVPVDALGGRVHVTARDFAVQEGARRFAVDGGAATIALMPPAPLDLAREANGDVMLLLTVRVAAAPAHAALGATCNGTPCTANVPVVLPANDRWVRYGLPLKCLAAHGADVSRLGEAFRLSVEGTSDFTIGEVRLGNDAETLLPCPNP